VLCVQSAAEITFYTGAEFVVVPKRFAARAAGYNFFETNTKFSVEKRI
jgi:hypothetical protein